MSVTRSRSDVAALIELLKECLETRRGQTEETLRSASSKDIASGAAPYDSDGSQRRRKYCSLHASSSQDAESELRCTRQAVEGEFSPSTR